MSFIREITKTATRSNGWRKIRNNHIKKQPECQCCGAKKKLEVHHKQPFQYVPELELDPSNLITLCDGTLKCHIFIGHLGNWKSHNVDVTEDSKMLNVKIRNRP